MAVEASWVVEINEAPRIVAEAAYWKTNLNIDKSELFIAGIPPGETELLLKLSGFKRGVLPVRYLGIPLISGRLSEKECVKLTDHIAGRIKSWKVRYLSFAGRIQLINSVISSMLNFLCATFILPKTVISKVEQICRNFLWHGSESKTSAAKVNWTQVCRPKSEGVWASEISGCGAKWALLKTSGCLFWARDRFGLPGSIIISSKNVASGL